MYFKALRSNTRGVSKLVKDSCPITNIKATIIVPGNLTKFNFTYKDEKFTLVALYAPNEKDIQFFETLFEAELDTDSDHTLYSGDWIISLSQWTPMDTYTKKHPQQKLCETKMIAHELREIWRDRNPHAANYT